MRGICPGHFRNTTAEALVPNVPQMAGGPFYELGVVGLLNSPARLTRAGWTALAGTFWPGLFHFGERAFRWGSRVISVAGYARAAMPLCSASDCASPDL